MTKPKTLFLLRFGNDYAKYLAIGLYLS